MNFQILPKEAARVLGVSADTVTEIALSSGIDGTHFQKQGRSLRLSEAGLELISTKLDPERQLPLPAVEAPVRQAIVWRAAKHGIKNRHVLEAYWPGNPPETIQDTIVVRVRDNSRFHRGQEISVRKCAAVWEIWDVKRDQAGHTSRFNLR